MREILEMGIKKRKIIDSCILIMNAVLLENLKSREIRDCLYRNNVYYAFKCIKGEKITGGILNYIHIDRIFIN